MWEGNCHSYTVSCFDFNGHKVIIQYVNVKVHGQLTSLMPSVMVVTLK